MARNDEGEFELVLGNRQLLSFFFLVVVLLGVFFTMGYIVGRNSGPVSSEVVGGPVGTRAADTPPVRIEPANSAMPEPPPAKPADEKPIVERSVEEKPAEPPVTSKVEGGRVEPVSTAPAAQAPEPPKLAAPKVEEAKGGQLYFQVVAVVRDQADRMAGTLKSQGIPAAVVPGPNESIFRVVVGPMTDEGAIQSMRAKLEAAGHRPILKRF